MFAGVERFAGQIEVRDIRRRDHDQIKFWKPESVLRFREYGHVIILFDLGAVAGNDVGEAQSRHVCEQRGVESFAGKSIAEQRDSQRRGSFLKIFQGIGSSGGSSSPRTESACDIKHRYLFSNRAGTAIPTRHST